MKRLALILGFVVLWRQWESGYIIQGGQPTIVHESRAFDTLEDARGFVSMVKDNERYTDMHIYEIGREIK